MDKLRSCVRILSLGIGAVLSFKEEGCGEFRVVVTQVLKGVYSTLLCDVVVIKQKSWRLFGPSRTALRSGPLIGCATEAEKAAAYGRC